MVTRERVPSIQRRRVYSRRHVEPGHGIVQRPKVSWQRELQRPAEYDGRDRRAETKK
jgi:hypothetical protein